MAYTSYRIGRKFGIGSFWGYCVPGYNVVLLCRCAGLTGWAAIWIAVGIIAFGLGGAIVALRFPGVWQLPLMLITYGFSFYLWGKIAQRLGKNFWLWGLGCAFLGIPVFVLAFGSSRPVDTSLERKANRHAENHLRPDGAAISQAASASTGPIYEAVYEAPQVGDIPPLVRCTAGEYAGQTLELPREGIVIGRDAAKAHLVLTSPEVSGSHARIGNDSSNGSAITVTDLGSTNGTYIWKDITGGAHWMQVHGRYTHMGHGPCRIRLGDGAAEFEITRQDSPGLYS
jgi:hypothetical protein